jgi:hypothetical protein
MMERAFSNTLLLEPVRKGQWLSRPDLSIPIRRASRRGAEARWRFRPANGDGLGQCSDPSIYRGGDFGVIRCLQT